MDFSNNDLCNSNSSEKGDYHERSSSPSERESVSLPPLNAMAFTIPLDEPKVKWKGKSFSIKDAIRKFAPPKPDTIEKQRPVKLKSSDTEKIVSKSKDKKKDDKGKLPKEPEGQVSDSASYLIQRMLNDESQQLQCDDDLDNENTEDNERSELKRSDSKRKTRNSDSSGKRCSSINGCAGEKDSGVCDDKSESGTYTLDKNDPVVEEARKRIDQVFGVPSDSEGPFPSPTSLDQVKSSLASITALKSILSSSKTDVNMYSSSTTINRSLNDHRRQSDSKPPLISSSYLNSRTHASCPSSNPGSDSESNSYPIKPQRKQKYLSQDNDTNTKDECSMWTRRDSMDRSSIRSRTNSFTKRCSKSPSSSPSPSPISKATPSTTVPISPLKSYTTGSSTNLVNQRLGRSHSSPRNGPDLDLGDCDDTSSLKSEASNASTTPSSGGGKGKNCDSNSNKASSMRFNRAFALRRAKLGMDTLGVPLNLTAERQAHHSSILESRSNPRSTPSPTFNRSDGGRFSLRLSNNNNNKSSNRKPPAGNPNHWSRQSSPAQPGTGSNTRQPVINKLRNLSTSSDTENRCSSPGQSPSRSIRSIPIQKSSSFHNPKDSSSLSSVCRDVSSSSNSFRGMSPFAISKRFFSNNNSNQMNYSGTKTRETNSSLNLNNQNSISNNNHHSLPPINHNYGDRRSSMSESLNDSKLSRLTGSPTRSIQAPTPLTSASAYIKQAPLSTPTRTYYNGESGKNSSPGKELSALDKLVISAIFQLSHKLRYNLRAILDNERLKYPPGSETRLMIEDLLPQVAVQEKRILDNGEISRDLSSILKNLKKVEQSYELVTLLLANGNTNSLTNSLPGGDHDFYGDNSISCTDFQDEY